MMNRLKKYLSRICLLTLILVISHNNYGATVLSTTIDSNQIDGGNSVKWEARNVYIKEIEVLRLHKNEAFSITVPEGPLIKGWRYSGYGNSKKEQEFEQLITVDNGITSTYGGSLRVNNTNGYSVTGSGVSNNRVTLDLEYLYSTQSKPTIRGTRIINVSRNVPDGRHNIYTTLTMVGTNVIDVAVGIIIIKTLPTISVEDIDFGDQPIGENIKLTETSNISIEDGTEGERYTLSMESTTGSGNINNFEMYLDSPNSNDRVPVTLSVKDLGSNPILEVGGNANLTLEAKIDAPSPSKGGEYTGRAKIIFQYD